MCCFWCWLMATNIIFEFYFIGSSSKSAVKNVFVLSLWSNLFSLMKSNKMPNESRWFLLLWLISYKITSGKVKSVVMETRRMIGFVFLLSSTSNTVKQHKTHKRTQSNSLSPFLSPLSVFVTLQRQIDTVWERENVIYCKFISKHVQQGEKERDKEKEFSRAGEADIL